ncbi:MAG TPA: glycerophosphodiester phosphodiesterase [Candidatus Eisenbacteria bacterium]|nr:glycerophosphodiester phosphodiesterase [Candidatus Eisenbacteria bacterium]
MKPLRLAHRGDWRVASENSVAAMRAALAVHGCDGLELDVRGSSDGVPVLLHDPTLERVHGVDAAVTSLTAAELAAHGIPSLAEVFAAVGREPFVDVELKGSPVPAVVEVLDAARGIVGAGDAQPTLYRAAISSFEAVTLAWLGLRRPGWARWLIVRDMAPATLRTATELECEGVSVLWRAIHMAGLKEARAAGLKVTAWTVTRRDTRDRLARWGVDAIVVEGPALEG